MKTSITLESTRVCTVKDLEILVISKEIDKYRKVL